MLFLTTLLFMVISDLKSYKVKNELILIGMVLGFIYEIYTSGSQGIYQYAIGFFVPIILLFVLFVMKAIGAGDIKMFGVIGGFYGLQFAISCIALSIIIGAVYSMYCILKSKDFSARLRHLASYFSSIFIIHRIGRYQSSKLNQKKDIIHFTPAIFISVIVLIIRQKL